MNVKNLNNIIKKLAVSSLAFCMIVGGALTTSNVCATSNVEEVPIYTLDKNGELILSQSPNLSALYQMMNESNNEIQQYSIPSPDSGNSIRITPIKKTTINKGETIVTVVGTLGAAVGYKGLFNAITKKLIGESAFQRAISYLGSASANAFVAKKISKAYQTSYMYKSWSSYYDCYIIYYTEANYKDSARKKLLYCLQCECGREYPIGKK